MKRSFLVSLMLLAFTVSNAQGWITAKEEIPFVADETPENILRFITKINPEVKCLKSYSLLIKK